VTTPSYDGDADGLPSWLRTLADAADGLTAEQLSRFAPPQQGGRKSAVLVLFGEGDDGPDVLLIERSPELRSHAGQPAFPGGSIDPGDAGPVDAALREAYEETGLDPSGVEVFATLPDLFVPRSGFVVTPVLGWWREPSPVYVAAPYEVVAVHRVPLAELVDPANRVETWHPDGFGAPAFQVRGMLVWGFTGGLLDRVLAYGGWEVPWDRSQRVPFPVAVPTALFPPRGDAADGAGQP
jgi:8-oxo-dGTP pyrophosphatase MutT (NUDIX family)